jgi:DNA replication protein DnaC
MAGQTEAVALMRRLFPDSPIPADVRDLPMDLECDVHGKWRWRDSLDGPVVNPECPSCICDRRLAGALDRAAIPPRYRTASLETYQISIPEQRAAVDVCRTYCADVDRTVRSGSSLLLLGGVGTGKTHLACGIAREFINQHRSAMYIRVAELISMVRESWRSDSKRSERKVYKDLLGLDLLILDEVGVQAGTENEQNILFNVINQRSEEMRPVILISNLAAPEVKEMLGDRSYSRICESARVVPFTWEDFRRKK